VDQGNTFSNLHVGINGGSTKSLKIDQNTFSSCQTVITANGPTMSILRNNCSKGDTFFNASNSGTDKLTVDSNTIANYRLVFDGFGNNTNTKVSSNTIQSVERVFFTNFNKDIVLTGNNITDAQRVFTLSNDTNVTINNNVLTRCTKPLDLNTERTVQIDKNTVTGSGAFSVTLSSDVAVTGNQMTDIGYQGVAIFQNSGTSKIENNVLKNCGLQPLYPPSVLYANGSGVISIIGNSYSGNTTNLTYFIETTVTTSHVSGNTTNTSLPNKVGF
jgi:nitrous oxidase accessory protein NosD